MSGEEVVEQVQAIKIFYSYAHEDQELREELEKHLAALRRSGQIMTWHDRKIPPGTEWANEIDSSLNSADVILLLVSSSFIDSDYCWGKEMKRALERHKAGEARVIPVILRPVDWRSTIIGELQLLPTGGKAVTVWADRNEAFEDVASGIREVVKTLSCQKQKLGKTQRITGLPQTTSSFVALTTDPVDRPKNYVPLRRNPLFQQRGGEFERLEHLLFSQRAETVPLCIGLVGMGGVGKTQLAIQLAYRYGKKFSSGVFWMSATGATIQTWQRQLAELAFNTEFLPPDDDLANPENECRRARHICRYLARHSSALLILDNVEEPDLVASALPALAGKEMACTILYTSRSSYAPLGVTTYRVEQLSEEASLCLLLDTRPLLLAEVLLESQDAEVQAARAICRAVGYLPLALVHLCTLLIKDRQLTLKRLLKMLEEHGMLVIANKPLGDAVALFATFHLSWEKITDKRAQQLFKLATYFPELASIPLWLLGLASGLGEEADLFEPLGEAYMLLQEFSFLEVSSTKQVRLHPLIREFGRKLIAEEDQREDILVEEAEKRITKEFYDLNRLERRIRCNGYFECLEDLKVTIKYVEYLGNHQMEEHLQQLEQWLDQESYILASGKLWPELLPNLLYQQLFNRSVKEGHPLPGKSPSTLWLRQMNHEDRDNQSLVRKFAGHSKGGIHSVAFSADGSKILTAGEDGTARLWDTTNGRELMSYAGRSRGGFGGFEVMFSLDGNNILTCDTDDKIVCLWEMTSGKLLVKLTSKSSPRAVAISPDSSKILIGYQNKTVCLWETANRSLLAKWLCHKDLISSVAFSPDGSKFLTSSYDGTAKLWEVEDGKLLKTLEHDSWVIPAIFSLDGGRILTGSDDGRARMWDATSGRLLMTLEDSHAVRSVALSPDGKWILTGNYGHIARLWEASSGRHLESFEGHTSVVSSIAFSPDRKWALTGSWDGSARLWDLTQKKTQVITQGHSDYVSDAIFFSDGSKLVTSSHDGTVRIWEAMSRKCLIVLRASSGRVARLALSSDGRWVLTCSHRSKMAVLWDISSRKRQMTFRCSESPHSLAFSPDSTKICIGFYQEAQIWETASGKLLTTLEGHSNFVNSVVFSPDGDNVLTGSSDGTVRLWDVTSGAALVNLHDSSSTDSPWMQQVAFSPDGTLILASAHVYSNIAHSWYGTAYLWETISGKLLYKLGGHTNNNMHCVAFSPDHQLAITCDSREGVYLWQVHGPQLGRLLGTYTTAYEVKAVHWYSRTDIILADNGGPYHHPRFYKLKLEEIE